jgi:hypothetical protein
MNENKRSVTKVEKTLKCEVRRCEVAMDKIAQNMEAKL